MFENHRVRVLETRYGPGVKSNMHSHPDVVAVAITPAKAKFTLADGQTVDIDLQAGEQVFVESQEHAVENTGASESHIILVELK
jgi:quercetin dioxygenase-like cupin family protein